MSDTAPLSNNAATALGHIQAIDKPSTAKSQAWQDNKQGQVEGVDAYSAPFHFSDIVKNLQLSPITQAVLPVAQRGIHTADSSLLEGALQQREGAAFTALLADTNKYGEGLPLSMAAPLDKSLLGMTVINQQQSGPLNLVAYAESKAQIEAVISNSGAESRMGANTSALIGGDTNKQQGVDAFKSSNTLTQTETRIGMTEAMQQAQVANTHEAKSDNLSKGVESLLSRITHKLAFSESTTSLSPQSLKQNHRPNTIQGLSQFSEGLSVATQRVATQVQGSAMNFQRLSSAKFHQQLESTALEGSALTLQTKPSTPQTTQLSHTPLTTMAGLNTEVSSSMALSKSLLLSSLHADKKLPIDPQFDSIKDSMQHLDGFAWSKNNLGRVDTTALNDASVMQSAFNQTGMNTQASSPNKSSTMIQASLHNNHWFNNMAEKVTAHIKLSQSNVQLQLEPESLGRLDIHIAAGQGLSITSNNTEVQQFLDHELNELQQIFNKVGVDDVVVKHADDQGGSFAEHFNRGESVLDNEGVKNELSLNQAQNVDADVGIALEASVDQGGVNIFA